MRTEIMKSLQNIKLIQGGMGVYVSNWRLARAVAMEKPGITAGTFPALPWISCTPACCNLETPAVIWVEPWPLLTLNLASI